MAEVVVFPLAHGLTSGVRDFAARLRRAGHLVHVPALYEGRVFDALEAGEAYAQGVGSGSLIERGRVATEGLPGDAPGRSRRRRRSTSVTRPPVLPQAREEQAVAGAARLPAAATTARACSRVT